jgi:hypothetical protein
VCSAARARINFLEINLPIWLAGPTLGHRLWQLTIIGHYSNPREARDSYSRGQWGSALKATTHSPKGDIWYVGALDHSVIDCPTASGLDILAHC